MNSSWLVNDKSSIKEYWEEHKNGGHREQNEEFLKKEANEKLYHLGAGDSLLDFGCGSADLLAYYALAYKDLVGVDLSKSMLENAEKRIKSFGVSNKVTLINADDTNVWQKVPQRFDRITSGQVIQYFTLDQIDDFIRNASLTINENGKIILFDIIDPEIYFLKELGLFAGKDLGPFRLLKRVVSLLINRILRHLKKLPLSYIGFAYRKQQINQIAAKNGFSMECVWSMYYEYRYHAILSKIN